MMLTRMGERKEVQPQWMSLVLSVFKVEVVRTCCCFASSHHNEES